MRLLERRRWLRFSSAALVIAAACSDADTRPQLLKAEWRPTGVCAECVERPPPTEQDCEKVAFAAAMDHPHDYEGVQQNFKQVFWSKAIICYQHHLAPEWVHERMLRHAELNVSAAIAVGNYFLHAERYHEALMMYFQAISLKPDAPHGYYNASIAAAQLGDEARAFHYLSLVFERASLTCKLLAEQDDLAPLVKSARWMEFCAAHGR